MHVRFLSSIDRDDKRGNKGICPKDNPTDYVNPSNGVHLFL